MAAVACGGLGLVLRGPGVSCSGCLDARWCLTCAVAPHVENCPVCFGFGLARVSCERGEERPALVPITAAGVENAVGGDWSACPECGGTPRREDREKRLEVERDVG